MNLGAEPKKVAILAGLALIGGYVFYTNVLAGPDVDPRQTAAPSVAAVPTPVAARPVTSTAPAPNSRKTRVIGRGGSAEFRPTMKFRPEDRPNYAAIDPTLKLDLLAKVQSVELVGGSRSIFQFGSAPPAVAAAGTTTVPPIHPAQRMYGPEPPPKLVPPAPPPPPPPPPAITLKFYGYSTPRADGTKRAFFLDGEDIFVAAEGELIKKRYRVVQIGVNSVVMEDTEHKNNRQTLVLQQEQA